MFNYVLWRYRKKYATEGRLCDRTISSSEQGFSILEVLVTILVITGFVLGSLQATVLATLLRVQAQDKQEAANWVQMDLELIRLQAFNLPFDQANCGNYGATLSTAVASTFPTSQNISIQNRNYAVTRTYSDTGNILRIGYVVSYRSGHSRFNSGGNNQVTTLSTEVLPDVAVDCN